MLVQAQSLLDLSFFFPVMYSFMFLEVGSALMFLVQNVQDVDRDS